MASSSNQQLFFLLLALLLPIAINGADLITQDCGENFTDNAFLQGNINSVLLSLVAKTSAHGFANSSYGTGADAVYGISECREGANAQACSACVSEAALIAHTSCPNSADLSIWYHSCYLPYTRAVEELLGIVGSAASWGENIKLGWGVMDSPNFNGSIGKLYGMAQCRWDLEQAACIKCLADAMQIRRESCGDREGCYVITASCSLRLEGYAFLFLNAPLDPKTPARSIAVGSL
ncbi:hypothetical protein KSP39_PZI021740 [Platanthera zijinensis]|uniref:Gnk2-homologous domain-containing protein n=1 Tax=Platanthera zijinensis TaxID=2320716 RepID=A0AAP0AX38_9ASPA